MADDASKRTKIVKNFEELPKLFSLTLESASLNFKTVLDCLIIDKNNRQAFPIEYKYVKRPEKIYRTFTIQITAQSLLVEENFQLSVPFGLIKFEQTNDLTKIPITDYNLRKVKEAITEINQIIQTEVIPEPTVFAKRCKDCGYFRICRRS